MTFIPLMRVAAQLRRIAKALEYANDLTEEKLALANPPKHTPKLARIDWPTVQEWQVQRYKESESNYLGPDGDQAA